MGSYIGQTEVHGRLRDSFAGLYRIPAQQADLDRDISLAEAFVNSYVGKRYAVPVSDGTAVAFLRGITLDVFERAAWARGQGDEIPTKVENAYQTALKVLKEIAEGTVTLGGATALAERPSGGTEAIIVDGNTPDYKHDDLEGF